jgi:hypothetical protein
MTLPQFIQNNRWDRGTPTHLHPPPTYPTCLLAFPPPLPPSLLHVPPSRSLQGHGHWRQGPAEGAARVLVRFHDHQRDQDAPGARHCRVRQRCGVANVEGVGGGGGWRRGTQAASHLTNSVHDCSHPPLMHATSPLPLPPQTLTPTRLSLRRQQQPSTKLWPT